jgi:hypothetical protein
LNFFFFQKGWTHRGSLQRFNFEEDKDEGEDQDSEFGFGGSRGRKKKEEEAVVVRRVLFLAIDSLWIFKVEF